MVQKNIAALLMLVLALQASLLVLRVQAQPFYGGTFVVGLATEPPHLNSAIAGSSATDLVGRNIIETLVIDSPQLEIKPSLAESWDTSSDSLTFTFHLVRNATWHDGKPFTAQDVVFNALDVGGKYDTLTVAALVGLESVKALDDYTVQFKFKTPNPAFLSCITGLQMLPKHLYDGTDVNKNPYNMKPVGTGPFKFKEWVMGSHFILVRNENYWRKGKPYLDRIVYKVIPDVSARVAAAEKGEIDYIPSEGFPFASAETLSKLPNWRVLDVTAEQDKITITYLTFNLRHPILRDVRVRTALAYAMDKDFILKTAYYGYGLVATSHIAKAIRWAYKADNPYAKINYDPALANRLLDEAGYRKDASGVRFSIDIVFNKDLFDNSKAAEVMRENLRAIGVGLQLKGVPRAAYVEARSRWEFDTMVQRAGQGPDPGIAARQYHSRHIVHVSDYNVGGYNNSRIDELFDLTGSDVSREKRKPYFYEIQDILGRDLPNLPLVEVGFAVAHSVDFVNVIKGARLVEEMDGTYWMKGYKVSPEEAGLAIGKAAQTLESLKGQWYDVSQSYLKLDQAKAELEKGNYLKASQLAQEAVSSASPPYAIYAGITLLFAVPILAGIYVYRKQKKA